MSLCVLGAAFSFFMPWVTCGHGVKTVSISKTGFHFSKTMLCVSAKRIFFKTVNKDSSFISYQGYRLPEVINRARENFISGPVLKFSKYKNVHIYSLLLYLYPVLLIVFVWLLRRYRRFFFVRYFILVGCAGVVCSQLFYAGFYDSSAIPFLIFLDYGFWTGMAFYVWFCVLIWKKHTW